MRFRGNGALWLYRAAILCALVLAPVAYVARQALVDPAVAFLPPSLRAQWVKHPAQQAVLYFSGESIDVVEFSHDFERGAEPADIDLELTVFGRAYVLLNDAPVWTSSGEEWKRPSVVHLHDGLRPGSNRIAIRVHNRRGFPAILVTEPASLRTPDGWRAALGPGFAQPVDAVPALFHPSPAGPLQTSRAWPVLRYATPLWVVLWLGVALLGLLAAVRAPAVEPAPIAPGRFAKAEALLPFLFIVLAICLNLSNAAHYPYRRSYFDWWAHADYVESIAATWRPPMAAEGWQMFQPPLYYYVAAPIYLLFGKGDAALKAVQFVNAIAGSLLPLVAWLQLRLFRPRDVRGTWVTTALVAFLPMSLYMNPLISNETFAGTSIALATYLSLRLLLSESRRPAQAAVAGLASGAALLSKFTGVFSFATTLACLGWSALWTPRPRAWRAAITFGVVALLVAGWFYARNVVAYGKPFVGAWDMASGFAFIQEPTFRTAGFFLNVGNALFQHPLSSVWTGFLDGHYATLWADAHHNFFKPGDQSAFYWLSIVLLLAVAPTIVSLLGLLRLFARALAAPGNVAHLAMVTIIFTTWWSLLFFAVSVPTYSSIKAFYFLSLVPSLAVCFATGRAMLARWTRWAITLLDVTVVLVAALAGWVFRF